jgi:hypothetical protein
MKTDEHNDRIVVALVSPLEAEAPPQFYLLEPGDGDDATRPLTLDLNVAQKLAAAPASVSKLAAKKDRTETLGRFLFRKLRMHPAIKTSVVPLLHLNPPKGSPFYLYFKHRRPDLEQLPWESLFAPDVGYLSQNRDFAVGRMFDTNSKKSEWVFEPPLKIAAVLGAGGTEGQKVDADQQWKGLSKAVNKSALPVQLKVLTCQQKLCARINRTGKRSGLPVKAELIRDRNQLFAEISEFAPHILHFFCHGRATSKPQLEVATWRDWDGDEPGTILIEGEQLKQNTDLDNNIWLVTLNCCESAKNGPGRSSLSMPVASNLVRGGIPAVIGMRERVSDDFANKFCALFYEYFLTELQRRLDEASRDRNHKTRVHWACGLFQVRQDMYSRSSPEWTLPVLHTRREPFELKLNPAYRLSRTGAAGRQRAARTRSRLSTEEIHQYGEELRQLYEDRKLVVVAGSKMAARRIDRRIAEINRILAS